MDDVSRRRQWAMLEWRRVDVSVSTNKKIRVQVIVQLGSFFLFQEL